METELMGHLCVQSHEGGSLSTYHGEKHEAIINLHLPKRSMKHPPRYPVPRGEFFCSVAFLICVRIDLHSCRHHQPCNGIPCPRLNRQRRHGVRRKELEFKSQVEVSSLLKDQGCRSPRHAVALKKNLSSDSNGKVEMRMFATQDCSD